MANTVITDTGIEVYENDITLYLKQYIDGRQIEDMNRETQSRWNAALLYIYKYVFEMDRDKLKYPDKDTYNDKLINDICDIYINLCYEYDKEVSILGFCKLTGINPDTVYSWGSEERRISSSCSEIYKKLKQENEESLSNKLISGSANPMKILPALNRRHNWNMPNTPQGEGRKTKSIEQIAAEHSLITDKNTSELEFPDVVL
jgi:hypothetical protein